MRSTVIIEHRHDRYYGTVSDHNGLARVEARAGLTPEQAAAFAAKCMIQHAQPNPDGGDLMAPPEVLELVPAHLRSIRASVVDGAVDGASHLKSKIANLEAALEAIHETANKVNANSTPIDLRALLQRISSDAYGALGGGA